MTEPQEFVCSETLRNGLAVTIRALRPDDRERVAAAIHKLDPESIYTRLFSRRTELTETALDRIMRVDPARDVALVVTVGSGADETVIASCRCIESGGEGGERKAELAFVVEEDYRGLGIASCLMKHLVRIARERGLAMLEADVLGENKAMRSVFTRCGLPMQKRYEGGTVHVEMSLHQPEG